METRIFDRAEHSEAKKCSAGEETLLDLEAVIGALLATVDELKHKLDPILESERVQTEGKNLLREPNATIPPYFSSIRECTYQARAARDKLQDIIERIGL